MTRFELATPATRTRCATKLRHIPTFLCRFMVWQLHLRCATICLLTSSDGLSSAPHPDNILFNFQNLGTQFVRLTAQLLLEVSPCALPPLLKNDILSFSRRQSATSRRFFIGPWFGSCTSGALRLSFDKLGWLVKCATSRQYIIQFSKYGKTYRPPQK